MKSWLAVKIKELFPGVNSDILIPPDLDKGDYSTNLPFVLAKQDKKNPIELSKEIAQSLAGDKEIKKYFNRVESAGGFINFYFSEEFLRSETSNILGLQGDYGTGEDKKTNINLEFVSANPTGPITVHNVRAAPYGDVLAKILIRAGYKVTKEYYVNDAGNQIRLLGESVARRYLKLKGKEIDFPENLYQGEYITEIAFEIDKKGLIENIDNFDGLVEICKEYSVKKLISSIKTSLADLGAEFDMWFSEKKLHETGEIKNALEMLDKGGHVYEKDGAKWLKMGESGAVLVKSDGNYSYLMGDIAYTRNKFIRGHNKAINIWGTDHHGDVSRLETGVAALGYEEGKLKIILHQLISIKSGGEKQRMSKRKGEFVILDELLKEVGRDAIRFFFLAKDLNTHMEFDLDLAKEQSKKNPVYYIQYANARLNSIFDKLKLEDLKFKTDNLEMLKEKEELNLMRNLVKFPDLIEEIAANYHVHRLAQYSYELASEFNNFYEKHKVVQSEDGDKKLEESRIALCGAVSRVLKDCLSLMGVSAPEKM